MKSKYPLRKIAIIGSGPMGLSLAGYLQAKNQIILVVRNNKQRLFLETNGVKFNNSQLPKTEIPSLSLTSSIQELSLFNDIDLIFIATKSTAIQDVCEKLKPILKPHTFVVSYQNGFNPGKDIIEKLHSENVLRMVLYYGAALDDKNQVNITFSSPPHLIGALKKEHFGLAKQIATLLTECGLTTKFKKEIEPDIWKKSLLNACASPICALTRTTMKEAMNAPSKNLICLLLREGIEVAKKELVPLPDDFFESSIQFLSSIGNHYPSMVHDVLNHSPTEITQLNEQICMLGKKHGIPTVANEVIVSLIQTIDFKNVYMAH